jgi:E3 ubiquitin-protein ligase TRIP12
MLYEFKTRIMFFKLTAFSSCRNSYYASELSTRAQARDEGGVSISRRRLEVPREDILEDAMDKLKDLQRDSSFLEFQFENEVGTGLGPTLEYYALIGKAIKEEPSMWKETTDNSLYPNPLNYKKRSVRERKKIEKFFELVGTITARSLMDERLIDLPISVVFWKLCFSETAILDDVEKIDSPLYKGLQLVQSQIDKHEKMRKRRSPTKFGEKSRKETEDSNMDVDMPRSDKFDFNCDFEQPASKENELDIEDLCLTFTLPGTENIDLVRNGHKKTVNEDNMSEYVRSTLNCLFNDAVRIQVNAFRRGINNVFKMDALK